ncbi:hypothetical protein AHAS_Ahas01G0027700 [Arachis hypogaea]
MDQVPFSSNIEKPFVFGSATIGIEKNKDKEVHVMEGAHAGDTTWTKVERKTKDKKVFLGKHDQDKSKKVYVDKSSNYVAKGEPAMKGINRVESSLHISKGNQVLKQARNFKLASSGFTSAQGPLLAIGDFNEILLSSEVKGGNFVSRRAERFGALLDECGLIDLGAHGSLYTWFKHMQGNRFISKRLDRAVATDAWCFHFPESYVENLARMHSDHCPIMVRCQGNDRRVGVKPFRFQVAWSYHPSFSSVVRGAWDKGRPNPIRCLSQVELDVMGDQELPSLSHEAIESLTRNVSKEEVRKVIMGMNSFKAPGADGFQAFFFKEYWEVVGTEVWELVKKAFTGFDLDSALFDTLVVLIPKVDNLSRMKEFRPISLCNVIYKIITKVVVERLRPFLQDIIGPLQGGFIPERGAPDNIIVAQEVLHFMKKTKSKKGVLAFKIDLEKAYDRVSWEFLEQSLLMFGFPGTIVSLIMKCVKSSSLSLMWNGNRLDGFQPKRGLRLGDPMSPYLFVICMERLSCLIARKVEVGRWKPVTVSRGGPVISHLLFADDLILFCKAKKSQVLHVLDTMATFCRASGMKVNFDKSRAICSMNVSRQRNDLFTGISSIRFANSLGKYLGVPLKHGRVTKADFNDVVDKLTNRLASWKGRFLNKAGRICLAKSVLSFIPIYRMQSYSSWSSFSILESFDDSKKVWRSCFEGVAKYLQNRNLFAVKAMGSSSYIWKSIVHSASVLKEGFVWEVGALSKNFWFDSLLHSGPVGVRVEFLDICEAALTIKDVYRDGARIPEKLRLLVWLCLHDAVPTQYLHFRRHLSSSSLCTRCNQLPETILHCFRDCEVVRSVWVSLGFSDVCFFGSYEVHDWFKHGLLNEGCSKFAAIIWSIWQDRNMGNFQGVFGSTGSIAYKARRCMVDFEYTTQNRVCCIQGLKPLSWSPPEPGAWKLNCDGSVNLRDDCAGFGWVIRDSSSQWVMGCSENSFGSSVIKMELWSIWKGLAWAWEAGLKLVVCETDCAAAFELVTGWQVLLCHLEKEVIQLIFDLKLRRDWDIRFELIPREANVVADRLAKMGSGGSGTDEVHLWHQPPEVVCPLLLLRT